MFIDQYDDTENKYLKKYANAGIILKKKENVHELPDKDFAVIIKKKRRHRKFPICDKKSTLLSLLYLLRGLDDLPEEITDVAGSRIKEACIKYDINVPSALNGHDIGNDNYVVEDFVREKTASITDDDFGLVYEENGKKIRKFPMPDEYHTKVAAAKFDEIKEDLDEETREKLAAAIKEKEEEFNLTEEEPNLNPNLKRDMEFKTRKLSKEAQAPYMKLVDKLENGEAMVKEASALIDRLDAKNNIRTGNFNSEELLTDSEKKFSVEKNAFILAFEDKEKTAAVDTPSTLRRLLNDPDRKDELKKKLNDSFDKYLVNDLCQDPQTIYNSLPEPHQNLIDNMIGEVNQ
jgi:hypothetical protein